MKAIMHHAPVDGGELTVATWGTPSADQAVLLIHGVTASHHAWDEFAPLLAHAGYYVIAPDLRGRGRSAVLSGPYGMQQHADDMVSALASLDISRTTVIGHSMGGFVGLTLAHYYPEHVKNLVLVDGGLPLNVPPDLEADEVIQRILGPTAERLARTFDSVDDYLDFWRAHPGFCDHWEPHYDTYFAYDLDGAPGSYTPATSYAAAKADTVDLVQGTTIPKALQQMTQPLLFVTCPRGLFDETPGLYAPEYLHELLAAYPHVRHAHIDDVNHYNIVMGTQGATALEALLKDQGVFEESWPHVNTPIGKNA